MTFKFNEDFILREFTELSRKCLTLPDAKIANPEWIVKNRYSNIQPYEEYRVIIKDRPMDYINATHWQLPGLESKFIATQAPLEETIPDFWDMIDQNDCVIIVSLLKFNNKHPKFWLFEGVDLVEELCENDTIIRKLEYNSKSLIQIQYLGWPDHGVPENLESFKDFILNCEKLIQSRKGTVVVHCSAGVGRTGTLVSILASRMNSTGINSINIPDTVFELRRRRHRFLVVESLEQYKLIYLTLNLLPPISELEHYARDH